MEGHEERPVMRIAGKESGITGKLQEENTSCQREKSQGIIKKFYVFR